MFVIRVKLVARADVLLLARSVLFVLDFSVHTVLYGEFKVSASIKILLRVIFYILTVRSFISVHTTKRKNNNVNLLSQFWIACKTLIR